ncbi:beta-1,3-glucanase family protein [Stigmatella aurantiaca]|nr:beta-1,3-glucanase family protein [Stigmatella aurantiaca]
MGGKTALLASGAGWMIASALGCGQVPETNSHEELVLKAQEASLSSGAQDSALATAGMQPLAATVPVKVTNKCPFPLHVALTGVGDAPLEKDAAGNKIFRNLGTGGTYTYYPPGNYPSGRVSAYKTLPSPSSPRELEKAEFTLGVSGTQNIYYNLTYVDHVGLPMQIAATGSGAGCVDVRCNKSYSTLTSAISNGCPDGLRYSMGGNTVCLAPRSFCIDGEYASDPRRGSICSRLDSEITRCAQKYPGQCNPGGDKTPQVYACSGGFFSQSAKWCAAITRGMVDAPDSTNVAQYYNTGKPYNQYAKWVHDQCGAVYGFPYDDYPMAANQAGFYSCTNGTQLNVTFCPAG